MKKQPWLYSAATDTLFILAPAFIVSLCVILFKDIFQKPHDHSLWTWVVFVLCIDVAHVYSTLYRTYFNKTEWNQNKTLLTFIPLTAWVVGCLLYSLGHLIFWRFLAYLAVFHFVRQQYGFMRLYTATQENSKPWLDQLVIYLTTLYPLLYWHTHLPRNFAWFVADDFVKLPWVFISSLTGYVYVAVLLLYTAQEIKTAFRHHYFNIPKNLIISGTALSWYVGIVLFNGDLAFTATNVVSHGIPYMALLWIYGKKNSAKDEGLARLKKIFHPFLIPLFLLPLVTLAFLEEGLWDAFIWRDHPSLFNGFYFLPHLSDSTLLALLIPLLSLPQITHYILDGFIWKLKGKKNTWKDNITSLNSEVI